MKEMPNRLIAQIQTGLPTLCRRQEGQTMVEYGLLLAGIALLVIGAIILLKDEIANLFEETATSLQSPIG